MAVEGGMKCVKFLVFFFNFVFWLCGLALIVVGILAHVRIQKIPALTEISGTTIPLAIIVVGVIIFFIAFFGCCGAWKENYCMITMFAILLSLIIIAEIATAITAYVYKDKLNDGVDKALMEMINKYTTDTQMKENVDKMQQELHCCGASNASDWVNFGSDKTSVPDTCCKNITVDCGKQAMYKSTKIYTTGCGTLIKEQLKDNILWVGVAVLAIAFVEIMGVVFACVLMKGIRKGYEVM